MAKEQNLSLNSSKISGACGRLMCCLRFEHDTYAYEIKRTPPIDSTVKTPDGVGVVVEISPLAGTIRVNIDENIKTYHRDNVKILSLPKQKKNANEDEDIVEE
jgi:cell fate regulator YaaT (PSP1 superfamily)